MPRNGHTATLVGPKGEWVPASRARATAPPTRPLRSVRHRRMDRPERPRLCRRVHAGLRWARAARAEAWRLTESSAADSRLWERPNFSDELPGPCNMHTATYFPERDILLVMRGGDGRLYLSELHELHIRAAAAHAPSAARARTLAASRPRSLPGVAASGSQWTRAQPQSQSCRYALWVESLCLRGLERRAPLRRPPRAGHQYAPCPAAALGRGMRPPLTLGPWRPPEQRRGHGPRLRHRPSRFDRGRAAALACWTTLPFFLAAPARVGAATTIWTCFTSVRSARPAHIPPNFPTRSHRTSCPSGTRTHRSRCIPATATMRWALVRRAANREEACAMKVELIKEAAGGEGKEAKEAEGKEDSAAQVGGASQAAVAGRAEGEGNPQVVIGGRDPGQLSGHTGSVRPRRAAHLHAAATDGTGRRNTMARWSYSAAVSGFATSPGPSPSTSTQRRLCCAGHPTP